MCKWVFIILVVLSVLVFSWVVYASEVYEIGREHGISPYDLKAIAWVETGWTLNPKFIDDNGQARGLFQIHKKWHPRVTDKQAFNPEWSAHYACKYLNKLGYQKNRQRAISRYNGRGKRAEAYYRVVDKYSRKFKAGGGV